MLPPSILVTLQALFEKYIAPLLGAGGLLTFLVVVLITAIAALRGCALNGGVV